MEIVTHIRKVTPQKFVEWLKRETHTLHLRQFPTGAEGGRFCLNQAQATNDYSRIEIKGSWTNSSGQTAPFDVTEIQFFMMPLDNERTEITTACYGIEPIQEYCAELLREVERHWKAEGKKDTMPTELPTMEAQSPAPNGVPKKAKQRSARLIDIVLIVLGVLIALVINVASSTLPKEWEPNLWLSWPLLGVLVILSIFLVHRQNGTSETRG